jgi:hypothetical protein
MKDLARGTNSAAEARFPEISEIESMPGFWIWAGRESAATATS